MMVGDGTNDVGALKAAHVGVSIVNSPDLENKLDQRKKQKNSNLTSKNNASASTAAKDRIERAMAELKEQELDPTIVKLGDASIASSFTSRRTSIDAVLTVIRQGRCTLVTTVQVHFLIFLTFILLLS